MSETFSRELLSECSVLRPSLSFGRNKVSCSGLLQPGTAFENMEIQADIGAVSMLQETVSDCLGEYSRLTSEDIQNKASTVSSVTVNLKDSASEALMLTQQCANRLSSVNKDVTNRCGTINPISLDAILTLRDCHGRLENWSAIFRSAFADVSGEEVLAEDHGALLVAKVMERLIVLDSMLDGLQAVASVENGMCAQPLSPTVTTSVCDVSDISLIRQHQSTSQCSEAPSSRFTTWLIAC